MPQHRIFTTEFSKVYPLYVQKAERKSRTKEEVDQIICWLTGYTQPELAKQIEQQSDFETFFAQAPAIHPNVSLIKGVVCGVRVEDIEDPLMQRIRYRQRKGHGEDSATMIRANNSRSPYARLAVAAAGRRERPGGRVARLRR